MMVKPQNLLRYVFLIVFAGFNPLSAKAHDWPFQVDSSERFHTQVRFEPSAIRSSYGSTDTAAEWLSSVTLQLGEYVSRRSFAVDLSLGKYCVLPEFFPAKKANVCSQLLEVAKPAAGIAPRPADAMNTYVVYSEHCFSDSYLPYDGPLVAENSSELAKAHSLYAAGASAWAKDKLGRLSAWHCEFIEQCHSAQFAADLGAALGSLRFGRSASSAAASGKLEKLNSETLPKFVYLNTRGGIVLAPAELAKGWNVTQLASEESRPELLFDAANGLRAMVSSQLENIAGSLISVARVLEPSADINRVAHRRIASQK